MTESPLVDSSFAVPVFSPGDDLIACLNKAIAFLTVVASSRFPPINNQLRTSSNLKNQATIQNGRVTVQQVQGRQGQSYSGNGYKSNATSSKGNNASGQARVVKCYNYQGEGHMARQCTQPKRPRNAAWYKDKAMLVEAQEAGQILDEEQLAFLADLGVPDGQAVQTIIPNNVAFQTEDLDTYDSDCDDISNAKAVLMANISNYGSDVISEVPHSETYLNDMENQSVHAMQDFEQTPVVDVTDNEITSDSNIIPYSQYLQETQHANVQDTNWQAQHDSMILSVIEQINLELERYKEQVKTFEQRLNIDLSSREKMIDSQMDDMIKEKLVLKEQVDSLEQNLSKQIKKESQRIKPTLYDGIVIYAKHVAMRVIDDEETLILEEESRSKIGSSCELPKVSLVNASLKKLKFHLAQFDSVVKKRTTPYARTEGEWGFEHTKAVFNNEIIPFIKSLKDIFNVFDKEFLNEIIEVQTVFNQMEPVVQQSSVDKQCLEIAKKELLLENDRLLQQIMSRDVLLTMMNSVSLIGESVNMDRKRNESCDKCFNLEAELLKSQNAHNDLLKKFFKNNDLKAQLQDKYTAICKLKEIIKSMREKSNEENVNYDYCEIETKNVELENSVAKLLSKNERLCNEINHVKQDLKPQIQDKVFVITSLKNDLRKVKGKEIVDIAAQIPSATTIVSGMNDRILQTPSRNKKNKVEAQPRKVNKKNRVVEPICHDNVKHSKLNANSDLNCATCKKSLCDDVHAKCYPDCSLVQLDLGTTILQELWGMVIISWETLLSQGYTMSKGLDITCFPLVNFAKGILKSHFRKTLAFIRNLEGVDLLFGSRDTNLYIISLDDMLKTSSLAKDNPARGIPRLKFQKDHLCSACALRKSKKSSHQPKAEDTNQEKLYLLHMDLCGPIRVASINGKRYILVIVDDYSRFTWVRFLKTKDEAPEAIIKCIKNIQVRLNITVHNVRTDNGTEFVNQTLREFYENVGILHKTCHTPLNRKHEVQ
ncbi:retrovirus-related pol polyprotein from transposon TNT 1-94 [Tanacetum coccineum]